MILRSTRTFEDVKIDSWTYDNFTMHRLKEILTKHQKSLKRIHLGFAVISENHLIELLCLMPNLEEITIDVGLINPSTTSQQRLVQMKHLRSVTCRVESAKIIFELSNNILTKLSFASAICDAPPPASLLKTIFEKQKNIVELNFDPKEADPSLLSLPLLKKLRINSNHHAAGILQHQQHLTSLFIRTRSSKQEFHDICNLKSLQSLETLSISVSHANESLLVLNRLQSLSELNLELIQLDEPMCLSTISLPLLRKLNVSFVQNTDLKLLLECFKTNFPNLKQLQLNFDPECSSTKVMPILLENKNLESLGLFNANSNKSSIGSSGDFCTKLFHENLKELKVGGVNIKFLLNQIIYSTPNLEKLYVSSFFDKNVVDFMKIVLMNSRKLTHISVSTLNRHQVQMHEITRMLKDLGKNLSHFEFNYDAKVSEISKLQQTFGEQFAFIYKEDKRIIMRNNKWI